MRRLYNPQRGLFSQWTNHKIADELKVIDQVLDLHSEFSQWVYEDLSVGAKSSAGANGMTAEQVLRAAIIKQQNSWTYSFLTLQCADSQMTRAFVRLDDGKPFKESCLKQNIARIRASTWARINDALVRYASDKRIESGRTVRMDATVVESNIHAPSDSSLLYDCVKVVSRVCRFVRSNCEKRIYPKFTEKNAKRLLLKISNARAEKARQTHYKKMLSGAKKVSKQLTRLEMILSHSTHRDASRLQGEIAALNETLPLVIEQTERRVIGGETVPPEDKIVSIFEPHTDIIVKGQRTVEFGHKVFLTSGRSGIVTDCQIAIGNPSDKSFFMELVNKQTELYGKPPRQTSADGGFASQDNVEDAQDLGVKDVCFSKKCGLEIEEMVKSPWVFEQLRKFRAGIEGVISTLKRAFGLYRANWKGPHGFTAYIHSAVVSYNLTMIARLHP